MPRRRYASRATDAKLQPPADPALQRDLAAVRDIVHASLRSDRPEDIFQFALDRVSPVVGATFASVYLVDGASSDLEDGTHLLGFRHMQRHALRPRRAHGGGGVHGQDLPADTSPGRFGFVFQAIRYF